MTKIAIVIPVTAATMIKITTLKTEAMTAVAEWPACAVVSGTLDDTGDIADPEVDDEVWGTTVDCTLEETTVELGNSIC